LREEKAGQLKANVPDSSLKGRNIIKEKKQNKAWGHRKYETPYQETYVRRKKGSLTATGAEIGERGIQS